MAGDFGLGLIWHDGLDYYRNVCVASQEVNRKLENDDQLDPEVASYGPQPGRAFPLLLLDSDSFNCIYSFTKRIKIFLIYDTIGY